MRLTTPVVVGALLPTALGALAPAAPHPDASRRAKEAQAFQVARLSWMAGCWEGEQNGSQMEEYWMRPAGGTLLGASRVVSSGKTVFTEFMQIRDEGSDTVMRVFLGGSEKSVPFTWISASDHEAVFENPQHDFPQRIIYRKQGSDRLFARTEGRENGAERGEDFHMTRGRCQ